MAPAVRYLAALAAVLLGAVAADAGTTGLNGSPHAGQAATASHAQATAMLAPAGAAAAELDRIRSLLVSWRGSLVLERYYNGARAATPANIKSAAKSVISALVGIAIDRQAIAGVRQPIADYFPSLHGPRVDPRKRAITIEDLLTMRSGPWVDDSFVPRTRSRWSDQTYGYGWWARELAGQDVRFAWGFGGQYIFIVPSLDLVVVTTSSSTVDESRRSHRRTVFDIVEQLVIEPIARGVRCEAGLRDPPYLRRADLLGPPDVGRTSQVRQM
jgi:CubicO group peptidase (beta-lactamase class C family)